MPFAQSSDNTTVVESPAQSPAPDLLFKIGKFPVTRELIALFVACACIYFAFFSLYFPRTSTTDKGVDFYAHILILEKMLQDNKTPAHSGLHLTLWVGSKAFHQPYSTIMCFIIVFSILASFLVMYRDLRAAIRHAYPPEFLVFMAIILITASAVYLPFVNKRHYLGIGTPNCWHSPTTIFSKPFALFVFSCFPLWLHAASNRKNILWGALLSFLLVVCTVIKPNFALVFLPAVGIYILLIPAELKKNLVKTFLFFLPVVLLMLYQRHQVYDAGVYDTAGKASGIGFGFMKVWGAYGKKGWLIPVGMLQALAFPLFLLACRYRHCMKNSHLKLAWIYYIIAWVVLAFFYENGERFRHGNFTWSYLFALAFLYLYSLVEFLRWMRAPREEGKKQAILQGIALLLLLLHFIGGLSFLRAYILLINYS